MSHTVKSAKGWSVSELAKEFGIDRRTVDKVLTDIEPRGEASTARHKTYRIADVAYPLGLYCAKGVKGFGVGEMAAIGYGEGQMHPDELPPEERDKWYSGEQKRKRILKDDKQLIPDSVHRSELAELARVIKDHLTSQADSIDAAYSVPPDVIDAIDKENLNVLHSIADSFAEGEPVDEEQD